MSAASKHNNLFDRLGNAFAALAAWSFDHRVIVLCVSAASLLGSLALSAGVQIDNSYEAYFDPQDHTFEAYEDYRDAFGSDEIAYILYRAPGAEHGVFDHEAMRAVEHLTRTLLDEVPFVYEVRSLTTADLTVGTDDGIDVINLEDEFPSNQQELLALRHRFLSKGLLVGGILNDDGEYGAIVMEMSRSSTDPPETIRLDPDAGDGLENVYPQVSESKITEILARPDYELLEFHHSGDVVLNSYYNRVIGSESGRMQMLTSLLIGIVLFAFFRSAVGVAAPLAVVTLTALMVVGFISALGWKLDLSFSSIPTLITAIGIAHAVHILSEFRSRFAELGERRAALVETVRLVGAPSLLTSLTTAAGFASMSFVPIKSIAHMGVYSAFGVMAAFAMSLTLLMALLSFGRSEPVAASADSGSAGGNALWVDRLLAMSSDVALRHRKAILAGAALVFVISVAGIMQIRVDSNWLDDFREGSPIKLTTERVDEVMGGNSNLIYLYDSGRPGGMREPAALREIERLQEIAKHKSDLVRKTYSIVDVLKDLNQVFHEDDPEYHRLPETRDLVAQYLLLYEMSGGTSAQEFVSHDYQSASLELRLKLGPVSETATLVADLDDYLTENPPQHATVTLTGIGALWLTLMNFIVSSQIEGFLIAFLVIAAILVGLMQSLRLGLISMIPNLSPVLLTLGVLGWFGLNLDYAKITIAGVAIGIAVDDTIHLVSRFRTAFYRLGRYEPAIRESLGDVGQALVITSMALVVGFMVTTVSELPSQGVQGVLLATTIVVALIADFLLLPALIVTLEPFGPEHKD